MKAYIRGVLYLLKSEKQSDDSLHEGSEVGLD